MATVCEWFGLKTTRMVFSGLASKLVVMVSSGLVSKPATTISPSLASKPVVGFLVEPQNQLSLKTKMVDGFSVWISKLTATVW
jgi:hypothetical protein